jgi:hypothetical protein
MVLAAFARRLDDEFGATAEFEVALSTPDVPPVRVTGLEFGITYEPLRRLWPLLGGEFRRGDVLHADVDELVAGSLDWPVEVATASEVASVADNLAALVIDHAGTLVERYPDVDALLAAYPGESKMALALLAGAGRFDEASSALAGYRPTDSGLGTHADRRFERQLRRWIDSRGDLALMPDEPPPPSIKPREWTVSDVLQTAGGVVKEVLARRAAVAAVQRNAKDQARAELRSLLEAELKQRGLTESPLWCENTLDRLSASAAERTQQKQQAWEKLAKAGIGVTKALRDRKIPEMSLPQWLEPPDHVDYDPRYPTHSSRWIAVALDDSAREWLDRVYEAVPRIGDSAALPAWIEPAADQPDKDFALAVHIGERRVGNLDGHTAAMYSPLIDAAARRDELPGLAARLTPRPEPAGYLLELQLPPTPDQHGAATAS